jgi:hypothetical protein
MAGRPGISLVFFLGGGDAEMAEIRAILQAQNIPFHDRQLRWGARLSEYRDELAQLPSNAVPVLVELEPDLPPPPGALVVDHHDQRAGRSHLCELRNPSPRHWFGGELPEHGFFGAHARLADLEIDRMSRTTPHSHHIFLFPFTIRSKETGDRRFMETMEDALTAFGWIPSPFHSEAAENQEESSLDEAELRLRYSERAYFHPFVRPAIFGESGDDGAPVMRYFTHPHGPGGDPWIARFLGFGKLLKALFRSPDSGGKRK